MYYTSVSWAGDQEVVLSHVTVSLFQCTVYYSFMHLLISLLREREWKSLPFEHTAFLHSQCDNGP